MRDGGRLFGCTWRWLTADRDHVSVYLYTDDILMITAPSRRVFKYTTSREQVIMLNKAAAPQRSSDEETEFQQHPPD